MKLNSISIMKFKILLTSLFAFAAIAAQAQTAYIVNTFDSLVGINNVGANTTSAYAIVGGDAALNDGYGGLFRWSGSSTAATNTYGVFKRTTLDDGRWLRIGQWNQQSAATAADGSTYVWQLYRNAATNVFSIGADNNNVYLQSQASYGLVLNSVGNTITLGDVGTAFNSVISATAALNFPSIPANASTNLTITVTGAAANDAVMLGPPAALTDEIVVTGFVSAANTVTVRATNPSAAAIDPASGTYRATVIKY